MSKQAFKRLRRKLGMAVERKPLDAFSWPGGYPILYHCADGGTLCPGCVNKEIALVDQARHDKWDKQWNVVAFYVHYEGPPDVCDHCNTPVESAYGDPEEANAT